MKIGIAVTLAALALALYFFLGPASSSSSSEPSSSESAASSAPGSTPSAGSASTGEAKARPPAPIRHGAPTAEKKPVLSYELHDGTQVHDHRAKPSEPNLDGYVVLPKTVSKVTPETLVVVRKALRPAMTRCIETHGAGAEEGARIQASLIASIQSELLRIDKVRVQISGDPGAPQDLRDRPGAGPRADDRRGPGRGGPSDDFSLRSLGLRLGAEDLPDRVSL
jgi:hypothetical protein